MEYFAVPDQIKLGLIQYEQSNLDPTVNAIDVTLFYFILKNPKTLARD